MKALIYNQYGPARQVFKFRDDLPIPEPGHRELLIKVEAISINPIDWKLRNGNFKFMTGLFNPGTKIPCMDFCGLVEKPGSSDSLFKIGDRVFGMTQRSGSAAEYCLVAEDEICSGVPELVSKQLAALPLASLTGLQALKEIGKIQKGHSILINGASGGVGAHALQIAKYFGVRVTAVCSEKNHQMVENLGADRIIEYENQDFTRESEQYDIIFDVVGNRDFNSCKEILTAKGTYITTLPGPNLFLDIATNYLSPQKPAFIAVKPSGIDISLLKKIIAANQLKPIINKSFMFEEAIEAFEYAENGTGSGKVTISM